MSVIAGASCAALATREKLRGGIGKATVRRYWPGQAPEWAKETEDDKLVFGTAFRKRDDNLGFGRKVDDDPRLRRLAKTSIETRDHRRVREAEIIFTEEEIKEEGEVKVKEEVKEEEEDEDGLEERRRRIREKNLKIRAQEEAELLPVKEEVQEEDEDEDEDDEDETEYETDDSDSESHLQGRLKPIYVPKALRVTIAERKEAEEKEIALEKLEETKLKMRKIETKQIVVEKVRQDEETRKSKLLEEADKRDVDTDDEIDEAGEYERWKTREMARIKREREEKETTLTEKEDVKKLRKMTEKERKAWEKENPESSSSKSSAKRKKKLKFMQRYYHKGAFYQEDDILKRDYSAPTGDDRLDKSKLPEVMKVKKFGHNGRSKWTHLAKEDTTKCGQDWNNPNDPRRDEYNKMMSV